MHPYSEYVQNLTRRHFFYSGAHLLGGAALASLLGDSRAQAAGSKTGIAAALPETHFPSKVKHVIYLHMVGGPSQLDLYDYKPKLVDFYDKDLPDSVRASLVQDSGARLDCRARSPIAVLGPLIRWAENRGLELADLEVRRPSLEDIYLKLTESPGSTT